MILSAIRTEAMNLVDEQTNPSSGKYSTAWWNLLINRAKDILADRTGYYQQLHAVTVNQYTQFSALPSTLCWGFTRVMWGTTRLGPSDVFNLEDDNSGWVWVSSFPNQPNAATLAGITLVSSSASDTTQTATVYGTTYGTDVVVTKDIVLTGVTPAIITSKTDWGRILYVKLWKLDSDGNEVGAPCLGDITIKKTTGGAVITTIPATVSNGVAVGDTSIGTLPAFSNPTEFAIVHPNIFWNPAPDATGVVYILGGAIPTDMTDSDSPTGLPARFHHTLADGAAALSQGADLYDQPQSGRLQIGLADWNSGIKELNKYLDSMNHDRLQVMRMVISR